MVDTAFPHETIINEAEAARIKPRLDRRYNFTPTDDFLPSVKWRIVSKPQLIAIPAIIGEAELINGQVHIRYGDMQTGPLKRALASLEMETRSFEPEEWKRFLDFIKGSKYKLAPDNADASDYTLTRLSLRGKELDEIPFTVSAAGSVRSVTYPAQERQITAMADEALNGVLKEKATAEGTHEGILTPAARERFDKMRGKKKEERRSEETAAPTYSGRAATDGEKAGLAGVLIAGAGALGASWASKHRGNEEERGGFLKFAKVVAVSAVVIGGGIALDAMTGGRLRKAVMAR